MPSRPTEADRGWTTPAAGSTYPLALLPAGVDPTTLLARMLGAVGVVLAFTGFVVVVPLVNAAVLAVGRAVSGGGVPWEEYAARAARFETVWGLLGAHLGLASLVLVVVGLLRLLHRRRSRWLWSVSPGMRWRYLLAVFLLAAVALNVGLLATTGWPTIAPQPGAATWLVVIALTAPLQAIGEEVLFRGYLMQALGLVWRTPWFAIVGSALVFALFHGTQNLPLFCQRFGFGIIAGVLVWRTGGLEASIGAHVANNLGAFTWAVLTSSVADVRAVQQITWVGSLRELLVFAVVGALALLVARRMRVPDRVA